MNKIADGIEQHVKLAPLRGKHYVVLKNTTIQRWGARQVGESKDYTTLNSTLWRRSGLKGAPDGGDHSGMPGDTYYFDETDQAWAAASQFVAQLRRKDIIK